MEISALDAFKLGFMARCAEEKLVGPSLDARMEKMSAFTKKAAGDGGLATYKYTPINIDPAAMISGGMSRAWEGYKMLHALPVAAAILGGGAIGHGLGRVTEPPVHEDEMRANELANTYKLYTEKAKARRKARQYRAGASDL